MFGDLLTFLYAFKDMTKAHRRICEVLCDCKGQVLTNKYTAIFPARELIAKKAKCSLSTVRDFIKKYEGILFHHKHRRVAYNKFDSNVYALNIGFFEAVYCLKVCQIWHHWEKKKDSIIISVSENPNFLYEKVARKMELRTLKLPTGYAEELPGIKSYINSNLNKVPKTQVPYLKDKEKEAKMGILQGMPLNFSTKQKAATHFSLYSIREASNDYLWYEKNKKIRMPDKFFMHRAKEYQHKYINLL